MTVRKTPGVYIVEQNAFPSSVVEAPSAIPAFIGYTATASDAGRSLHNAPTRITSMVEFERYFGGGPQSGVTRFSLTNVTGVPPGAEAFAARDAVPFNAGAQSYLLTQTHGFYVLHPSMRLFFANGGHSCVVVSVGTYSPDAGIHVDAAALMGGLDALERESSPTLVVIPEAVLLPADECLRVQRATLRHCGEAHRNRFAILDIREGYRERSLAPDCVGAFRDGIGDEHRSFGAAYYPWVRTSLSSVPPSPVTCVGEGSLDTLIAAIEADIHATIGDRVTLDAALARAAMIRTVDRNDERAVLDLDAQLRASSGAYVALADELHRRHSLLPASAAVAGVYAATDTTRGVWTAPASVSLNAVTSPSVSLSDSAQDDLRLAPDGLAVNAIRRLPNGGTLVWGARTLDGHSNELRYVSVRRTLLLLEDSIRVALTAIVFEPNDANTWAMVRAMITNYLMQSWRAGMFAGTTVTEAFAVRVGLGETMTDADVARGLLRVTVLVAIVRPAEFLVFSIDQRIQTR